MILQAGRPVARACFCAILPFGYFLSDLRLLVSFKGRDLCQNVIAIPSKEVGLSNSSVSKDYLKGTSLQGRTSLGSW